VRLRVPGPAAPQPVLRPALFRALRRAVPRLYRPQECRALLHCPARARTHRESRALLSACSAAVLRYLANSPGHSAVWLAHLRPPRALYWLAEVPEYQPLGPE
jgi:hypothetical protein